MIEDGKQIYFQRGIYWGGLEKDSQENPSEFQPTHPIFLFFPSHLPGLHGHTEHQQNHEDDRRQGGA
jgi:hypothetical protein